MITAEIPTADARVPGVAQLFGAYPGLDEGQTSSRLEHEPQAYEVTQGPGSEIAVHYHPVGQFQLVVDGQGVLGRDPVRRGSIHYVDAFRPYGPITAGADSFSYLTLRSWADRGAWYMPKERDHLTSSLAAQGQPPRRNLSVNLDGVAAPIGWVWLIDDSDGLRAGVRDLRPADGFTSCQSLPAAAGDGAYLVVLDGEVEIAGPQSCDGPTLLGVDGVAFISPGETDVSVVTRDGARLCWLQLPNV